jgi:hypothetical protein
MTGDLLYEIPLADVDTAPVSRIQVNASGTAVVISRGGLGCCGAENGNRLVEWWGIRSAE